MVRVIVPEGRGQYSHLAAFSLAVVCPACCVAIMPTGNVRERLSEREKRNKNETLRVNLKAQQGPTHSKRNVRTGIYIQTSGVGSIQILYLHYSTTKKKITPFK